MEATLLNTTVDAEFASTVRGLLEGLEAGREPPPPEGGLGQIVLMPGLSTREAVARLAEQWFGPVSFGADGTHPTPPLNDEHLSDAEKQAAVLLIHVGQRRPLPSLSTNESTFYRYRRAAFGAFVERCWAEISKRVIPTNRPRPEYDRFVGRSTERAEIVRRLATGHG
ncbi:MAG: hypothetical protein ACRDIY_20165, partial [Chloroflexota bacterium]